MTDRPTSPLKIIGLTLCWVVFSFVRSGPVQNLRLLGPLFLVEVEFLVVWGGGGGGMNSNNHVKPNQVNVRFSCG